MLGHDVVIWCLDQLLDLQLHPLQQIGRERVGRQYEHVQLGRRAVGVDGRARPRPRRPLKTGGSHTTARTAAQHHVVIWQMAHWLAGPRGDDARQNWQPHLFR